MLMEGSQQICTKPLQCQSSLFFQIRTACALLGASQSHAQDVNDTKCKLTLAAENWHPYMLAKSKRAKHVLPAKQDMTAPLLALSRIMGFRACHASRHFSLVLNATSASGPSCNMTGLIQFPSGSLHHNRSSLHAKMFQFHV